MKKIIALLLVSIFMFSLVACGGDSNTNTDKSGNIDNNSNHINGADSPQEAIKIGLKAIEDNNIELLKTVCISINKEVALRYSNFSDSKKTTLEPIVEYNLFLWSSELLEKEFILNNMNYINVEHDFPKDDYYEACMSDLEIYGLEDSMEDIVKISYEINKSTSDEDIKFTEYGEGFCIKLGGRWYILSDIDIPRV